MGKSTGDGEISISWMSPAKTGGSPVTGYIIERYEIASDKDSTDASSKFTLTPRWARHDTVDRFTLDHKLKNLNIGSLYSIRVSAENAAGLSPYAEIREPVTAKNMYSPPDAPTGPLRITNITRETVDASWLPPRNNGGSPLLSYFIEKRDIKENIWIKVARVDPDIRTLKIFNLLESNEYELRVSAENEYGKSKPLVSDKFKPLRAYGNISRRSLSLL
jgi:titin